jgi:hypothetical protein
VVTVVQQCEHIQCHSAVHVKIVGAETMYTHVSKCKNDKRRKKVANFIMDILPLLKTPFNYIC